MEKLKKEPTQEQESKETPKKKKGKTKKILLWSFGIFLGLMLIVLCITAWIMAALFDPKPLPLVNKVPDREQYQSCLQKFKDGAVKLQSDPNELVKDQTIILSKKEVNAVLDSLTAVARGYLVMRLPDTTICDVRFEDGALFADVSQKVLVYNPFGQYMNMKLAIIPRVENNHLYLDVKSLQAGSMELSGDWVQGFINKDLKNFEKTDDGQMVVNTIKGLKLEPDKVHITYSPIQVQVLLMQQTLKLFSNDGEGGADSGDLLKLLQLLQ